MITRDGWLIILIALALTAGAIALAASVTNVATIVVAAVVAALTVLTIYFFRDPERVIPKAPGVVVSPADGRVVAIKDDISHVHIGGKARQVSIFLSVFDVHVNRVPVTGSVTYVSYVPGKFLAAFDDKASLDNEQTEIGMIAESGHRIVFKQIAGLIARRIVCRLKAGDTAEVGDRMGMIKFGSRTDIILPADTELRVQKGDRVWGGRSVIGYLSGTATKHAASELKARDDAQL